MSTGKKPAGSTEVLHFTDNYRNNDAASNVQIVL